MNFTARNITLFALFYAVAAAPLYSQTEERPQTLLKLRAEQDEVLRKAVRLKELMERLQQRYVREQKTEQVALLQKGLEHLQNSAVLQDVASIRDDLTADALSEAIRKQQAVITDIERLLNILLQRKSVENLDQAIADAGLLAATARELEKRQAELLQLTQNAAQSAKTEAEQQLDNQLDELAAKQRDEAAANARAAGSRRPFLENALQRVQQLLKQQSTLEQQAERLRTGEGQQDRERAFDLGELVQRTRELSGQMSDQTNIAQLQKDALALTEALRGEDQAAVQQQKDRLESDLQKAPKLSGALDAQKADPKWQQLKAQLENLPGSTTAEERAQLDTLAKEAAAHAAERTLESQAKNTAAAEQLAEQAAKVAQQLDANAATEKAEKSADAKPSDQVRSGQQHLQNASQSSKAGESARAQDELQQAQRDFEAARRREQEQNPAPGKGAAQMAAEADATEKELRNAPNPGAEEPAAADSLAKAEQALRKAEQQLDNDAKTTAADARPVLAESRQDLTEASDTLQKALEAATFDQQEAMQKAASRQAELQQKAKDLTQQMQQQAQSGELNAKQAQAAQKQIEQAMESMQGAEQLLQQNKQSKASSKQQEAAGALQQAKQELQKNRTPPPEQQKAMQELAEAEKKLEADILKLAEESKKKNNQPAEQALQAAAEAARRAQSAMQQQDQETTEQQQERARQKLDEAAKQMEEERDRYQDLRQEELLFRMKEELTAFLEKQKPITLGTLLVQKANDQDSLSRPMRRKLNQFGEEEQELSAKLSALILALAEEGNLVWQAVLKASQEDLGEVVRRLGGRNPDPTTYTTMLQQAIERRTTDLLSALEREQKRREQERTDEQKKDQQQDQQQKGKNKLNQQRQKLVSLIAELELLKTLEADTRRATSDLQVLLSLRSGDDIQAAEAALVERLAHRHSEVTKMFQQIKAGVESALSAMQGSQDPNSGTEPKDGGKGRK
jgi:hypothetical protein